MEMHKRNILPPKVIRRALFGPNGVWTKYFKKRAILDKEQKELKENRKGDEKDAAL
jgi:hypothetical protein